MPFQSEKQRKYLWANEPKIARDWTEKYGSRVKKDMGGITRLPFFQGGYPNFFQMTPENIATANATSWADAFKSQLPQGAQKFFGAKNTVPYRGFNPSFKGGVSGKNYIKSGLQSIRGNVPLQGGVGGADTLTRKIALGASKYIPRLLSKAALPFELLRTTPANADEASMTLEDFSQLANNNQSILPKAKPRMTANWSQFDDAEAQASGMFKEEDEDGNWFDRMRRWGGPIYNAYKGNTLGAIVGAAGGLPGMALGAFFGGRNLKNSAAYRPATKGAYGYSPAQLNRMNALGGHYSEPARQQRQTVNRVNNMMARKAAGKSYSTPNLSNLSAQISRGRDPSQGNTVTGHGKSGMGRDPNDRMAQGGLASLWQR